MYVLALAAVILRYTPLLVFFFFCTQLIKQGYYLDTVLMNLAHGPALALSLQAKMNYADAKRNWGSLCKWCNLNYSSWIHGDICGEKNHCWFVIFIILHANEALVNYNRSKAGGLQYLMIHSDTVMINRPRSKVVMSHVEIITLLLLSSVNLYISSLADLFVILNISFHYFSFLFHEFFFPGLLSF